MAPRVPNPVAPGTFRFEDGRPIGVQNALNSPLGCAGEFDAHCPFATGHERKPLDWFLRRIHQSAPERKECESGSESIIPSVQRDGRNSDGASKWRGER